GPPGGARGVEEIPRRLLHLQLQSRLRRGLDGGGRAQAVRRAAPGLSRRRARPHGASLDVLGPTRPAPAVSDRRGAGVPLKGAAMLQGIDHIVIAVPDLDRAAQSYASLGFTVVQGGRHPVGTHNALIGFADGAYIELIAFYEKNTQHKWWEPLQKGGGLV